MKKIIGIFVCMLLIAMVIPTSTADMESQTTSEDDVEINIYSGIHRKDIGFGIAVDILNHKTENVTVFINITVDYPIINKFDFTFRLNQTISPEIPNFIYFGSLVGVLSGIKSILITVEAEDTIVKRKGISIGRLVILSK